MIEPNMSWFEIVEVLTYDLDEVTGSNDDYIDKYSSGVIQMFNKTWISRYPNPLKVVFDNGSGFIPDFTPVLKVFDIKPAVTTIKNPQPNASVERVHQVIINMLVTKDLANKVFDYIGPWGETL